MMMIIIMGFSATPGGVQERESKRRRRRSEKKRHSYVSKGVASPHTHTHTHTAVVAIIYNTRACVAYNVRLRHKRESHSPARRESLPIMVAPDKFNDKLSRDRLPFLLSFGIVAIISVYYYSTDATRPRTNVSRSSTTYGDETGPAAATAELLIF